MMDYWHWLAVAAALFLIEVLVGSGAFFLWFGFAALASALLAAMAPGWFWAVQVFVFSLFSIISLGVWWKWYRNPVSADQPLLNERVAQYVGRVFTLSEPVVDGFGRVHVDDSYWKIKGADCVAGTRVQVTGVDGMALVVKILRS